MTSGVCAIPFTELLRLEWPPKCSRPSSPDLRFSVAGVEGMVRVLTSVVMLLFDVLSEEVDWESEGWKLSCRSFRLKKRQPWDLAVDWAPALLSLLIEGSGSKFLLNFKCRSWLLWL